MIQSWNYLRVRGEYSSNRRAIFKSRELPPRARRILHSVDAVPLNIGTTSACAENTGWWGAHQHIDGNYLRVRGEYCVLGVNVMANRTTSACAENIGRCATAPPKSGNYLRVRGEYETWILANPSYGELPPRARRIRASATAAG